MNMNEQNPRHDFKVHPLADLFPLLPPDEFRKLKEDIRKNGLIEPIMVMDDDTVIDGRNRLKACRELGIEPDMIIFEIAMRGNPPMTVADFIWSKNVLRRHLTDDQRAAIGHKWADAERAAAKQQQKRKPADSVLVDPPKQKPINVRKAIAAKAKVSEHKVRQVETVAKHAPELLRKVESGEMKLKDAEKVVTKRDTKPQRQRATKPAVHIAGHLIGIQMNLDHQAELLEGVIPFGAGVRLDPSWKGVLKSVERLGKAIVAICESKAQAAGTAEEVRSRQRSSQGEQLNTA